MKTKYIIFIIFTIIISFLLSPSFSDRSFDFVVEGGYMPGRTFTGGGSLLFNVGNYVRCGFDAKVYFATIFFFGGSAGADAVFYFSKGNSIPLNPFFHLETGYSTYGGIEFSARFAYIHLLFGFDIASNESTITPFVEWGPMIIFKYVEDHDPWSYYDGPYFLIQGGIKF